MFFRNINFIKNFANNSNYNLVCIICASLIPLLVTGPFLPDLIVSIMSLWFLYYLINKKLYYKLFNLYFLIFLVFCLVCVISSFLSEEKFLSLTTSLFYFRIGVFALLISYLIDKNKNILNYFFFAFLITYSALIIDGYTQYFTGLNILDIKIHESNRLSSFFGDELILGSYLTRLFPLFAALFFIRANKKWWEYFYFFIFLFLVFGLVILSRERVAFFLFMLAFLFIFFFSLKQYWLKLTLMIIFILLITSVKIKENKIYNHLIISPYLSVGFKQNQFYFFSIHHDALIKNAFSMFLDKPILGHGPKLFRVKCEEEKYKKGPYPCSTHPHNFYVQLLAETGILGFLFLFSLFLYFIFISIRHLYEYFIHKKILFSDYQICLLAGLLITLWPLVPSGSFFNNYLMILYSLQIGFLRKKL